MAKILQPDEVIRLYPDDIWNKLSGFGFKWHLFFRDSATGCPRKTACGIVLENRSTDESAFGAVSSRNLCATCFKGFGVIDE